MKKTLFITILVAAVTCSVVGWSQSGKPGRQMPGGPGGPGRMMISSPVMAVMPPQSFMIDHLAKDLQLTKDQTTKLKTIATQSEKTLQPLREQSAKSTQALRTALLSSNYNAKNVKTLASNAQKAEGKVVNASIDTWTKMRAVLTASQASKLQKTYTMQRPGGPPPTR